MAETMIVPVPDWMAGLCADPSRASIARPFTQTYDGAPCVCATNGHALTAVLGTYDAPASYLARGILDDMHALAATPGRGVRLDALRAFCDVEAITTPVIPCATCDTRRTVECADCDGDGYRDCDMGHEHKCPECDGRGVIQCGACGIAPAASPDLHGLTRAWVGGAHLDRRLLGRVVAVLPGTRATWHANPSPEKASVLASADAEPAWVVAIMPVRNEGGGNYPSFEAWDMGTEEAANA